MSKCAPLALLAVLGLAACDTAPPTLPQVTFVQVSDANLPLFDDIDGRAGWGAVSRSVAAEGRAVHRLTRIAADAEEEQKTKKIRQCVLSLGRTVLAAERTTFADGDVGLLVTCSQ